MKREPAIRTLIAGIDRYLLRFSDSGISDVHRGIAGTRQRPVTELAPRTDPLCGHLDGALAVVDGADGLVDAIEAARPHLHWVTYDEYPRDEIGPRFPNAHACATVIGPSGLLHAGDFELGLFLIAPHTLYRDHHHQAPELYAPPTGSHRWRFGGQQDWKLISAHRPVWNEPWTVHATLVDAVPLLCIYSWTRDVDLPAKVVQMEDWPEIEAGLDRRRL